MPEEWLIDGYNFLHSLNSRKAKPSSKISRESCLSRIAAFTASQHCQVTVVLDGVGQDDEFTGLRLPVPARPAGGRQAGARGFCVVYSGPVSADAHIEKYLFENKGKASFVVVTEDRAIADMARGSGACVMDAQSFMERLEAAEKDSGDILFKHKVKAHGFHRPFEDKI